MTQTPAVTSPIPSLKLVQRVRQHLSSSRGIRLALTAFGLLGLSPSAEAQISITKIGESKVTDSALPFSTHALNFRSHQDDAIVSFNGYQYCVFYSIRGNDTRRRFVSVGRRKLPDGAWEKVVLTDYTQTTNDNHNVIAMGVCEGDGTIHLAFDHHNDVLNYRVSVRGLATNPEDHRWVASKFNAERDNLPGLREEDTRSLTYPRFFNKPDGDLHLVHRRGSAIAGRQRFLTYSQDTQEWTYNGLYIDGTRDDYRNDAGQTTRLNPYLHGIAYDDNDRLHISWVWRTTNGRNFDFMYAYSDDFGRDWQNTDGQNAGRTRGRPMHLNNPVNLRVFEFPEGSLLNQTGQAIDSDGRVHVVQRDGNRFRHIYRDTDGTWHDNRIDNIPSGRYKITTDQNNNVYLLTPSARIYAATPGNDFNDWELVYDDDAGRFRGDAMFDEARMKREGILTMICQTGGSGRDIYTIDLSVSPISQNGTTFGNGGRPGTGNAWVISRRNKTRIQAENFNQGGDGVGHSDDTSRNIGGQYRANLGVDIERTTDAGGGFNVGWTSPGEWLRYTIDVQQKLFYNVTMRSARVPSGRSVVRFDWPNESRWFNANPSGGWQSFSNNSRQLLLEKGEQTLQVNFLDGNANLNWFEFEPIPFDTDRFFPAGDFDAESHPNDTTRVREFSNQTVGALRPGTWVRYSSFNFGERSVRLAVDAASGRSGGTIEARVDSPTGPLLGEVNVNGTGSFTAFRRFSVGLNEEASGIRDLYLVFRGGGSVGLLDLRSLIVRSNDLLGFRECCNEGGSETFSGRVDVAYGANGQYVFRRGVSGRVQFTNDFFGTDPIPGVAKKGFSRPVQ